MTQEKDEERAGLRSQIETLILITGLVMMPYVYLWQQTLTIIDEEATPAWQSYLQSQLGTQYTFQDVIGSYLTPFALSKALPVDLIIIAYDAIFILSVLVVIIFGFALVAIEKQEHRRVEKLVKKGNTYLTVVLVAIIFFGVVHILTTILFPLRLLVGFTTLWAILGVAFVTAIVLWKLVSRSIEAILGIKL